MIAFGHLKEFFNGCFGKSRIKNKKGYAPIFKDASYFYVQYVFNRLRNAFNRTVTSSPTTEISIKDRYNDKKTFELIETSKIHRCINFGSYNYLGMNEKNIMKIYREKLFETLDKFGLTSSSSQNEYGYTKKIKELENEMSKFLRKEDCIVVGMGFATNSLIIPCLLDEGTLVISDELNHNSIITGIRNSKAKIKVFRHNDFEQLEEILRVSIVKGRKHKNGFRSLDWKKIIVFVEGIYSMEGEIVNLPKLIQLKEKYKFYLYMDEAHSIGALGDNGAGVCDFYGIDTNKVDVMMGTFTKSFCSVGGYIAGDKILIDYIRKKSFSYIYANSMNALCAEQVIQCLKIIKKDEGKKQIMKLKENSKFFKKKLEHMGFEVVGSDASPIICVMIYLPTLIEYLTQTAIEKGVALVAVGAPATKLIECRLRMCINASHTKKQLKKALLVLDELGDTALIKHKLSFKKKIYKVLF